jgi:hypothetical protein
MAKIRVPCNQETAADFGDRAERVQEQLLELSDVAQTTLGEWPDAAGTGELRTLLLEVVETAEAGARRWQELARRLEGVALESIHLHLVDGELLAVLDPVDAVEVQDTIDTAI